MSYRWIRMVGPSLITFKFSYGGGRSNLNFNSLKTVLRNAYSFLVLFGVSFFRLAIIFLIICTPIRLIVAIFFFRFQRSICNSRIVTQVSVSELLRANHERTEENAESFFWRMLRIVSTYPMFRFTQGSAKVRERVRKYACPSRSCFTL